MFSSKPVHLVSDVFPNFHHNSIVSDSSAVLTSIELFSNFDTIRVRLMLLFNIAIVTKHTSMSCFGLMPCFHCSIGHHISCPWFRATETHNLHRPDSCYGCYHRLLWLRLLWLLGLDNCCSPHKAPSGKSHQKNSAPTWKLQSYYAWKIISSLDEFKVYEKEKDDQLLWL